MRGTLRQFVGKDFAVAGIDGYIATRCWKSVAYLFGMRDSEAYLIGLQFLRFLLSSDRLHREAVMGGD